MLTYIIIADAARARIFCRTDEGEDNEIENLVHPACRTATGNITAAPQVDDPVIRRERAKFFAAEVANYLRLMRTSGDAGSFVITAEPGFLRLLRGKLDQATRGMVTVAANHSLVPVPDRRRQAESA